MRSIIDLFRRLIKPPRLTIKPMAIQCVIFDLDDTLWAIQPVIANAEKHYYAWLEKNLPKVSDAFYLEDLTRHRHQFFKHNPHLHHDLTKLRKKWMALICKEFGYSIDKLEEGFTLYWKQRNNVTFFDKAINVLNHANQNYRIGALTNGNADVGYIGIGQYFNFFLTSAEVGSSKPDPAIFEKAIDLAQCPANQVVHVGDDPITDIAGAANVGMKTIWVNTFNQSWVGSVKPDAEIQTIAALPEILATL